MRRTSKLLDVGIKINAPPFEEEGLAAPKPAPIYNIIFTPLQISHHLASKRQQGEHLQHPKKIAVHFCKESIDSLQLE